MDADLSTDGKNPSVRAQPIQADGVVRPRGDFIPQVIYQCDFYTWTL
jgi:hypothetical protein